MIRTISIRDQVKEYLQTKMMNGKVSFGARISMPELSKSLGVSITPIREALTQLSEANIINSIPNRGFFLPTLNKEEALEIYPIIACLEEFAVKESEYRSNDIKALEEVLRNSIRSNNSRQSVKLDFQFHDVLLRNYTNGNFNKILKDLKIRVFLYEISYRSNPELSYQSWDQHARIIEFLSKHEVEKAAHLVKENWLTGVDFIKRIFEKNQSRMV